ncbi:MAG TPA: hypothetical protein VEA59_00335 [Patescibacteria group bacterium]|nr:hypothetical protein [Patescibacteria group bacterium]
MKIYRADFHSIIPTWYAEYQGKVFIGDSPAEAITLAFLVIRNA